MPSIEYVILADHAEVANGKLNLIGGGWAAIARPAIVFPPGSVPPEIAQGVQNPPSRFAVALAIGYDWFEAGDQISFAMSIKPEDEILPPVWQGAGNVQTGRPPGVPKGTSFRAMVVFLVLIAFPQPGGYIVHTVLNDSEIEHKLPFQVLTQEVVAQPPPQLGK
jgi:hypothetical protein